MATVQLAIPLIFYIKGARSVPAVTLTLIAMLDAVINPLWPWIFVGENPGHAAYRWRQHYYWRRPDQRFWAQILQFKIHYNRPQYW